MFPPKDCALCPASDNKSGNALLLTACEVSGTLAVYECRYNGAYTPSEEPGDSEVEIAKQQTTDPTNPPKSSKNNSNTGASTSPRTGDNSNLLLWAALLLVSIFGVAGATFYDRKKKIR